MSAGKWSARAMVLVAAAGAVLVLLVVVLARSRSARDVPVVPFSDLLARIETGTVSAVVISGDTLDFMLRDWKPRSL